MTPPRPSLLHAKALALAERGILEGGENATRAVVVGCEAAGWIAWEAIPGATRHGWRLTRLGYETLRRARRLCIVA